MQCSHVITCTYIIAWSVIAGGHAFVLMRAKKGSSTHLISPEMSGNDVMTLSVSEARRLQRQDIVTQGHCVMRGI